MTPQQLADTLPRVSAGINPGDWTDDDDRLAWATKVLELIDRAGDQREAECVSSRDPYYVRHGDTWVARKGRATIVVATNDWPPPPAWAIPTQPSPPAPGITYHDGSEAR